MKTYILTEDERVDLYEMALRGENKRIAAFLKYLPERTSVTLEAEPEAPKDWRRHRYYGLCKHCPHNGVPESEMPCCECVHCFGASKEVDHWQPKP